MAKRYAPMVLATAIALAHAASALAAGGAYTGGGGGGGPSGGSPGDDGQITFREWHPVAVEEEGAAVARRAGRQAEAVEAVSRGDHPAEAAVRWGRPAAVAGVRE